MDNTTFPNARKATITMFYANMINIVNFVVTVFVDFIFVNVHFSEPELQAASLIAVLAANIIAYILPVISIFMIMYALHIGSRDDHIFRYGFILILANIALIIILLSTQVMVAGTLAATVFKYTAKICNSLINVFICLAISRLFNKMGDRKKVRHGHITAVLILAGVFIGEASSLAAGFTDPDSSRIHTVLSVIYVILSLLRLLIYSAFLRYARKNL